MWKLIIISTLLVVAQTEIIENFFNQVWTIVAIYPVETYVPVCIQFMLTKSPSDFNCNCTDGKNATLAEYSYVKNKVKTEPLTKSPMIVIDVPNEVGLDVNCTCGEHHYTSRVALRAVKKNYLVIYAKPYAKFNKGEPNTANVAARVIPKHVDLFDTLSSIEDLKNRQGAEMCASDMNADPDML